MTREFTPEQEQIIIDALRDRIGRLFDMAESYEKVGFEDCQMDCLDERKRVRNLLDTFTK